MCSGVHHDLQNPSAAGARGRSEECVGFWRLLGVSLGSCDSGSSNDDRRVEVFQNMWAVASSSHMRTAGPIVHLDMQTCLR
jgi:hypothetical protein